MNNNLKALNLSIFYSKTSWYEIINECIYPFIKKENNIIEYFLQLNDEGGDNIRLCLITLKIKARCVAETAEAHFNQFLKKNNSNSKKVLVPKNEKFFLDFDNNNIYYGIYNFDIIKKPEIYRPFQQSLSNVIIEVFHTYKDSTINEELEISLQILTIFCNSINFNNDTIINFFDILLKKEYSIYNQNALEKIHKTNQSNFNQNKSIIVEYLSQYRKNDCFVYEQKWQNILSQASKEFITILKIHIGSDKTRIEEELNYTIDLICNSFNIKDKITLYYLFSNALKKI